MQTAGRLNPWVSNERELMFAGCAKIKPSLEAYERAVVIWDENANEFRLGLILPRTANAYPMGHLVIHDDGGETYIYYCHPFPLVRVEAN